MDFWPTVVFRFSTSTIGAVFAAGVLAIGTGIWLIRSIGNKRFGYFLIIMGLVAEVLLGPCLIKDHITITSHSYDMRTGFWFDPTVRHFEFKDVNYIAMGYWTDIKGQRNTQWEVHLQNGSVVAVPTGNLWQSNRERIIKLLRERGVRIK